MKKVKTNVSSGKFEGTYTHYRIQPDGSLKRMGEVAYRHDVEPTPGFDTLLREIPGLAEEAAEPGATRFLDEVSNSTEAFETLVDLANESEG